MVALLVVYDPGLRSGIFAGAAILLFLLVGLAYFLRVRRGDALLRKLPHRHAKCMLDDGGVRVENALGSNRMEWRMLEKVVRGPDVWLMFYSRQHYFPLPAAALSNGAGQFLVSKVTSAGGKVLPKPE